MEAKAAQEDLAGRELPVDPAAQEGLVARLATRDFRAKPASAAREATGPAAVYISLPVLSKTTAPASQ